MNHLRLERQVNGADVELTIEVIRRVDGGAAESGIQVDVLNTDSRNQEMDPWSPKPRHQWKNLVSVTGTSKVSVRDSRSDKHKAITTNVNKTLWRLIRETSSSSQKEKKQVRRKNKSNCNSSVDMTSSSIGDTV